MLRIKSNFLITKGKTYNEIKMVSFPSRKENLKDFPEENFQNPKKCSKDILIQLEWVKLRQDIALEGLAGIV